jgi:glucose/arabinose dehydrogenase
MNPLLAFKKEFSVSLSRLETLPLLATLFIGPSFAKSAEVPTGFEVTTVLDEINAATAFTFTPDGRILILDQTGKILVVKEGHLLDEPMLSVDVDAYWERGLIGIALHPNFPETPHLFINHTPGKPYPHHRISRFTVEGDKAIPKSERILFEGDDQTKLGGHVPHGHQGGPIAFGPDGKLYIALGEQTAGDPSQSIDSLLGKILRINADGSIPINNPFSEKTTGKYRAIWATGIRNPYGLEFHPSTGDLYENDVGQSAWEEINVIQRGANYGWPKAEGPSEDDRFTNPIHAYPPVIGRSITGGTFYRGGTTPFPVAYRHQYFFLDFMNHWIRIIDPSNPQSSKLFGKNFNGPVDIESGPDGSLYVLNRGTIWRDGKRHAANAGSLQRIRYTGSNETTVSESKIPHSLSEAKVFDNLTNLVPADGFHPFQLNLPRWRPHVAMKLWIRVPEGKTIRPSDQTIWDFPTGTVFIQHFDTDTGTRLESHLYWAKTEHCFQAAAYRWNADQNQATLVEDSEIISHPGFESRYWFSPGFEECLNLNTTVTGFVLELNTRQLNYAAAKDINQLSEWRQRGWLAVAAEQLNDSPKLVALDHPTATVEEKVRSYLDTNCAACHFPGGPSRGGFDARFQTPLTEQNLINGSLLAGDLGVEGARMVVPGSPEKSILFHRINRKDFFRMPPVALNNDKSPILAPLKEWIQSLEH